VDCGEVKLVERPLGLVEARSPERGGSHLYSLAVIGWPRRSYFIKIFRRSRSKGTWISY